MPWSRDEEGLRNFVKYVMYLLDEYSSHDALTNKLTDFLLESTPSFVDKISKHLDHIGGTRRVYSAKGSEPAASTRVSETTQSRGFERVFGLLREAAAASGNRNASLRALPIHLGDEGSYIDSVECDCARELLGIALDWRPPIELDLVHWPVQGRTAYTLECHLVLVLYSSTGMSMPRLWLHVSLCADKADKDTAILSLSERKVDYVALVGRQHRSFSEGLQQLLDDTVTQKSDAVTWTSDATVQTPLGCISLGYVGDLMASLEAASQLRELSDGSSCGLVKAMVGHRIDFASGAALNYKSPWQKPSFAPKERNESQHMALGGLRHNLELICGPPGTGKSTTIETLIHECVGEHESVLLIAVQNRAIEALAEKLVSTGTKFIVVGSRATGTASEWTMEEQISWDPDVEFAREELQREGEEGQECQEWLKSAEADARYRLSSDAKVVLCTADTVNTAIRKRFLLPFLQRLGAVVVDEAGNLGDRHMVKILVAVEHSIKLQRAYDERSASPRSASSHSVGMVLVGDTKQLPMFSRIKGAKPLSVMERLEQQYAPAFLNLQYRMPTELARVVSNHFYDGNLRSAHAPLTFLEVNGDPCRDHASSSYNEEEAEAAVSAALKLNIGAGSVAILSQYKAQVQLCLSKVDKKTQAPILDEDDEVDDEDDERPVEVLTVDAAQGREWDHVS